MACTSRRTWVTRAAGREPGPAGGWPSSAEEGPAGGGPPCPRFIWAGPVSWAGVSAESSGTSPRIPGPGVAVGTALTGGPPRRSQRAGLPHWAPTLGVWRRSAPPGRDASRAPVVAIVSGSGPSASSRPWFSGCGASALSASTGSPVGGSRPPPLSARDRKVGHVPAHHAGQPAALLRYGLVHAPPELVVDRFQLGPHPFRDRDPLQPEPPVPCLRADVREAQEVERLRLALTPGCPVPGGLPPELDQPGLIRVQLQPELREPAAKLVPEPLSVLPVLEPDDEIVSEAHDDHITARVPLPPPVGP